MFRKILVANRGEIAVRIIRAVRRMGIATVAVHSDADRHALHVEMADESVALGGLSAAENYLAGDRIIAAALSTGAEAIHPGYGFLSENPEFAEAVEAAGLVFVGPSPSSIRAMGLKDTAKRLMERSGVPVVPGYHGDAQELVVLAGAAQKIGYPVLIKARAGGGGRGMRRVDRPEDFAAALMAAKREAQAAFGDGRVLVEKLIEKPRHIEVQVFGDRHGNIVHLFERDCSCQRRHQKVIEEAPAPGIGKAMRAAITEAAVRAARAVGYYGAGTVEFIADASRGLRPDAFWFMEMNTRLQVEHPVTEMITGIDLVEWQIRIAAGEALPLSQSEINLRGHAIEARIYAEDPERDFLPATGTLHHVRFPESIEGVKLRIDAGVREGDTVSPYYDPMIAKVIVHAGDRKTAIRGLKEALEQTRIAGCTTNTTFLHRLVANDEFAAGEVDTGLIARNQGKLTTVPSPSPHVIAQAALALSGISHTPDAQDPFDALTSYGHFHPVEHRGVLYHRDSPVRYWIRGIAGGRFEVRVETPDDAGGTAIFTFGASEVPPAARWLNHVTVFDRAESFTFSTRDFSVEDKGGASGSQIRAPMPGLVKLVRVAQREKVQEGQPLLVLEAMKMEHAIIAPRDGVIAHVVAEGVQVSDGTVLIQFEDG
jgi:Acetyl/propionyl-CoA carboxylase, alpha subunit